VGSANVDLVRSINAAWERGDYTSVEWAHPDIEYVIADGPAPSTWRGLAATKEGARDFLSAWQDHRAEAEEFREIDDVRVPVLERTSVRGRSSGLPLETHGTSASLFHERDGEVVRFVMYFDRDRALTDLGLAPQTGAPDV
jgi:ketosteroid isomerase-like protein